MKGKRYILLLILVLFASIVIAQEKNERDQNTAKTSEAKKSSGIVSSMTGMCQKACAAKDYNPVDVVSILEAKIGDLTTCPVSGVVFRITEASSKVKFKDDIIYTCCSSCASLYNHDPNKYAPSHQ